jgi:RNA polymerase sigma factor (sigma-70 family)
MNSATETFAVTLARASKQAMRFLRARGLTKDARDDVIAAAMLWCWENQNNYSLTATLEVWFLGAMRNAYRDYLRGEIRNGTTEIVENMGAKDDPEYNVVLQDAVATLAKNMDEIDRAIVQLTLNGKNQREVREALSVDARTIERRLAKMREQIPASAHVNTILRRIVTPPTPESDELDVNYKPQIDKEIEALEFVPPQGKECPPCWRCKWFEGYMPGKGNRYYRFNLNEVDVSEAVAKTEREKVRIAQEVRNGAL